MNVKSIEVIDDQTRKFCLTDSISAREKSYEDSTQALQSPVASKIFGFPWTQSVIVGSDFVAVTKQEWVEWSVLEEPLKGLLEEHFQQSSTPIEENPEMQKKTNNLDSPEAHIIKQLIEEQINPALSAHGGYVVLHSVEDNQVYLEMGGGCQGCAMSYQTMKEGIEGAIKQMVPTITQVVDVTNHSMGDNPFYT